VAPVTRRRTAGRRGPTHGLYQTTVAGTGVRPTMEGSTGRDAAEPQALVASFVFDSGDPAGAPEPYSATVRFNGRRVGVRGTPKLGDSFVHDEVIDGIVPGGGPISVTATVDGVRPGAWNVHADLIRLSGGRDRAWSVPRSRQADSIVHPAAWSWRHWSVASRPAAPIKTRWAILAPLASRPAVIPGVYTALAIVGFILALGMQAALLGRGSEPVGRAVGASVIGLIAGLAGAKAWYAVLHPDESILKGGWAVDGFLVVAPLATVVALRALDVHAGAALDAVTPGLFFAVALGRVGCFLTGCCAGRCTAGRWGIWSSDRRVGARRVPAQLLESAAGVAIGVAALAVVIASPFAIHGAVFATAFALYALVRQALLRLRAERRRSYRTLPMTAAAAALVVVLVSVSSLHLGP
jgi:phosphatidylglycerol:prolipoprotein diacylglycerol transferase